MRLQYSFGPVLHSELGHNTMGSSKDSKKKDKGSKSSSSKSSNGFTVPSDHKETVQAILDYVSSLGMKPIVLETLENATSMTAVRIFHLQPLWSQKNSQESRNWSARLRAAEPSKLFLPSRLLTSPFSALPFRMLLLPSLSTI